MVLMSQHKPSAMGMFGVATPFLGRDKGARLLGSLVSRHQFCVVTGTSLRLGDSGRDKGFLSRKGLAGKGSRPGVQVATEKGTKPKVWVTTWKTRSRQRSWRGQVSTGKCRSRPRMPCVPNSVQRARN